MSPMVHRVLGVTLCTSSHHTAFVLITRYAPRPHFVILCPPPARHASSKRWQARQAKDRYTREATVRGLRSRAAFKLIQINDKYRIFEKGQRVVDLGYAPGSWSQVALDQTQPSGRVVGVDIIPAQPPKGVSTIQGNFLSPEIQSYVRAYLRNTRQGTIDNQLSAATEAGEIEPAYIDRERRATRQPSNVTARNNGTTLLGVEDRTVDVVLSDMSAPWDQVNGFCKRSISDPYYRMMNTSGLSFRDHAGSMDLCRAALDFAYNVLKTGGHFVCKFYQGPEDKSFENQLKVLFNKVHREKPESSRGESKEAYFIGLKRKHGVNKAEILSSH